MCVPCAGRAEIHFVEATHPVHEPEPEVHSGPVPRNPPDVSRAPPSAHSAHTHARARTAMVSSSHAKISQKD